MNTSDISMIERETIINYNMAEKTAIICTADKWQIEKLNKLVEEFPDQYKFIHNDEIYYTYECPKKLIAFRKPVILSEEKKQELRDRLKNNAGDKKGN